MLSSCRLLCCLASSADVDRADDAPLLDLVHTATAQEAREVRLLIHTRGRRKLLDRRPDWTGGLTACTSLPHEPLDAASTRALVAELG